MISVHMMMSRERSGQHLAGMFPREQRNCDFETQEGTLLKQKEVVEL